MKRFQRKPISFSSQFADLLRPEFRVVRAADGTVSLDLTGKKSGRGAYLCKSLDCYRKARKTHRIERTLSVEIPAEVYDAMERELADG